MRLERGASQRASDHERDARHLAREVRAEVLVAFVRERRVRRHADHDRGLGEDLSGRDPDVVDAEVETLGAGSERSVETVGLHVGGEGLRHLPVYPCMMHANAAQLDGGRRTQVRLWLGRPREERVGEREGLLAVSGVLHGDVERDVIDGEAVDPERGRVAEDGSLDEPEDVGVHVDAAHPGEGLAARRADAGVEATDTSQTDRPEPSRFEGPLERATGGRVNGPRDRVKSWAGPEVGDRAHGEREQGDEEEAERVERASQRPSSHQNASPTPSAIAIGTPASVLGSFSSGVSPPITCAPGIR